MPKRIWTAGFSDAEHLRERERNNAQEKGGRNDALDVSRRCQRRTEKCKKRSA